jgi:DNA (cytosine-5)-methyltransferase 1
MNYEEAETNLKNSFSKNKKRLIGYMQKLNRKLLKRNKWYLEQIINSLETIGYYVDYNLLNASYFHVPQNRERVFVVGYKNEGFKFPQKHNKIITAGEALGKSASQAPDDSKFLTKSMDKYIAKYEKISYCINPRDLYLDKPARTLTCRNIAASTSDMHRIKLPDGRRRRLFTREAAKLQSFPDWFRFEGKEDKIFYQIGNAVPPMLSYYIAQSVKDYINNLNSPINNSRGREIRIRRQLEMFN